MITTLFLKECNHCGGLETRLFIDSWTGTEVCIDCLSQVIDNVTMSPEDEEDGPAGLRNVLNTVLPQDDD